VSPYRDPRTLVALIAVAGTCIVLIVLVNRTASGSTRTIATIAVAAVLWVGLMVVLRAARRGGR